MSSFLSSFKDTTCKLHYPFNIGFNNPRFFFRFFFFSFLLNKILLQLFNLFRLGAEGEVCILSHPLEAPVTHPELVLPKFIEFPYSQHQVGIYPFTSCWSIAAPFSLKHVPRENTQLRLSGHHHPSHHGYLSRSQNPGTLA